jgi:hypothetical protein
LPIILICKEYAKVKRPGDKLAEIDPLIDWELSDSSSLICMIKEAKKVAD